MKILVVLLVAIVAACSAELDPKCAWGQSYWCSGLDIASSCGALAHCKTTVWKNQLLKQDGSDSCIFCKALIADAKKYLEQGKTEAEISHFLSSACSIIPDSAAATKCKQVADTMITEVLQLITSDVEPQMICSLLGVCAGLKDNVLHSPIVKSPAVKVMQQTPVTSDEKKLSTSVGLKEEPICKDCKQFFTDIKQMITANQTEAELEQMIDQAICTQLGSLEEECKALVHQYIGEIVDMIANYYDPNVICSALGVCNTDSTEVKYRLLFTRLSLLPLHKSAVRQNSASTCLMCKAVMSELQVLEKDAAIQKELIDIIKTQFCSRLGSMKDVCEMTVSQYSKELFEMLATFLEPSTRCHSLGFCDAASSVAGSAIVFPGLPLTPAKRPISDANVVEKDPSPQCVVCQLLVKEIQQLISKNATEEEIIEELEKGCSMLPESLAATCKEFVDTYGKMVIEMLIHEIDPEKICIQLHLCDGVAGKPKTPVQGSNVAVGNTEMCAVCETIVQYLEALLEQGSTMEQIEALLDKICEYLPASISNQCESLVKQYGDLIIHYISTLATPKEVCTLVGVCKEDDIKASAGVSGVNRVRREAEGRDIKLEIEERVPQKPDFKQKVPLLGQNECTWGPYHWCSTVETATKCNKLDYCRREVWGEDEP